MTLLDLCSYLGLGAVGAVTVNLLLGMLMSLRYSPIRNWLHRHINVFLLHQWTAYIALFLTLSHPAVLLFLHTPHFGWMDVLWPVHSYLQPKLNLAGACALYLIVLVLVSSLLRAQIGRGQPQHQQPGQQDQQRHQHRHGHREPGGQLHGSVLRSVNPTPRTVWIMRAAPPASSLRRR